MRSGSVGCMNKRERNDKGLTLIELLVALAIVSVVVSLAFGLIIHTIRIYTRGNNDSILQNDAQLTMSQLESLVLNANMGIGLNPESNSPDSKNLYLYYRDYEQTSYNVKADGTDEEKTEIKKNQYQALHVYVDSNKGLSYCTRTCEYYKDTSTGTAVDTMKMSMDYQNPQVLSKYVKDFSVDLSHLEDKSEMKVTLKFSHGGKNYESTNTIMLRNKVKKIDNANAGDYFQVLDETVKKSSVTGIQIRLIGDTNATPAPAVASYFIGSEFSNPFFVRYNYSDGSDGSGQTIWTLEDGVTGVEINRQTGFIKIKPEFTESSFRVYATSLSAINNKETIEANKNQTFGTIMVKKVESTAGIGFTTNSSNVKERVGNFTFRGTNLEAEDVQKMHLQVTTGSELRPTISSGTLNASGVSYQVFVHRPIDYIGKQFPIKITCTLNENTKLTAEGIVEFTVTGHDSDKFNGVKIIVQDSTGTPQTIAASSPITLKRNDQATFRMVADYKYTDTKTNSSSVSETDVSTEEWKLNIPTGFDDQIALKTNGDGYTLNCDVKDYNHAVSIPLTSTYRADDGTWKDGPVITLTFPKIYLTLKNVLSTSQEAFPITRGRTQNLYFDCGDTGSASLRVANSSGLSKLRVSVSGLNASVTASTAMESAETVIFGLKSGDTILDGVEYPVKFYAGPANTRNRNGGELTGENSKYKLYVPYVNELTRFDSTQALTESGNVTLYTVDGMNLVYSENVRNDKSGRPHQYWVMIDGSKIFYYDAIARQWRLDE